MRTNGIPAADVEEIANLRNDGLTTAVVRETVQMRRLWAVVVDLRLAALVAQVTRFAEEF